MPCLLHFFGATKDLDVDVAVEGIALLGGLCATLAAAGLHHGLVFAACFACYLTLFLLGQTWLSFQWDIFLLETGFAAILYAPWWSLSSGANTAAAHPMTWVLRCQWVKFMVCSGVVKITADCPTWKGLSALEFHFASTCLPTSEAWMHHSLPPTLLRLGVAYMFLCELAAPWLLLVPITPVRRVGVLFQLPLQALIALSGNYNWFNLHTAVLLLPAWERDAAPRPCPSPAYTPRRRSKRKARCEAPPPSGAISGLLSPLHAWERMWASRLGTAIAVVATLIALAAAARFVFPISYTPAYPYSSARPAEIGRLEWLLAEARAALLQHDALTIRNRLTPEFVYVCLGHLVTPTTTLFVYTMALIGMLAYALGEDAAPGAPPPPTAGDATAADADARPGGYRPVGTGSEVEGEGVGSSGRESPGSADGYAPVDPSSPADGSRDRSAQAVLPSPNVISLEDDDLMMDGDVHGEEEEEAGGAGGGERPSAVRRFLKALAYLVRVAWRLFLGCACLVMLGVTLMPLSAITRQSTRALIPEWGPLRSATSRAEATLQPFHASSSYGLFRRMTGVGAVGPRYTAEEHGWGGLPPSIVEVPAVVIEGMWDDTWHEIPLRYAPYNEARPPRRTAPHQPRLDWQMWFAALGSYQTNPWLLHLMYKMLRGNSTSPNAALQLLDLDDGPYASLGRSRPPQMVRAWLYHYDFTRVNSPWARRIPGVEIQPERCTWWGPYTQPGSPRDAAALADPCRRWWVRTREREYVPALSLKMLEEQVIKPQKWPMSDPKPHKGCASVASRRGPKLACEVVLKARRAGARLRRLVGWRPSVGGVEWFVDGFVDGPLVLILCAMALPLAWWLGI